MKRALIGSLSFLAVIVGTQAANAQADINPNLYPPYRGAPAAQQPWEWYAGPGPSAAAVSASSTSTPVAVTVS
jgi:hypothetical protein